MRSFRTLLCASALVASVSPELSAQVEWTGSSEVGSSLYWGSRSQSIVTTDGTVQREDSLFRIRLEGSFVYGEAEGEDGEALVSRRSWEFELSTDYEPEQRLRAYFVAGLSSSFEKRFDSRWNLGLGGKYSFSQERGRRVELSLAVELERTEPSERARRREGDDDLTGRWSTALNIDRSLVEDRLRFTSTTDYRPEHDRLGTFTASTKNSLSLAVTEAVDFKISLIESYDSEAVSRGADQNQDGRLVFSVATRFR